MVLSLLSTNVGEMMTVPDMRKFRGMSLLDIPVLNTLITVINYEQNYSLPSRDIWQTRVDKSKSVDE
jgi:hypothetical protein